MDTFEDAVLKTIARYRLLNKGEKVLVALSGGPDSVALLLALFELRAWLEVTVEAGHVNHLLRGSESDQDEDFVRALCARLEIPLHLSRIETRQPGNEPRQNLEERARRLRYDFLLSVAAERQATVATGHNLNDLSETFLLKLFRGAGVSGLSGIYPRRRNQLENGVTVDVIRPLLDSSRSEVVEYLDRREQPYRQDSSNRDVSFDRNLLRHEVIPLLERRLNPGISRTLGRTAQLFRELEDFLSPLLDEAYRQCREGKGTSSSAQKHAGLALRVPELLAHHPFVQKEIVRRALKEYRGDLKDVSYQHVADILKIAAGASGTECDPGNGVRVRREFDLLRFGGKKPSIHFEYELSLPGNVYITEVAKRVSARQMSSQSACADSTKSAVLLNFAGNRLRVRNRRAGDRYRTGARTRKLKEILIERRVPRSVRDELLVLDDGSQILWVEGFEPNPDFRARPGSSPALEITVEHETFGL
ncbi:MAG: tRNA lysidine(34) synthetase TilS [Acidobacteria bacterium]|nr:MAG: tRNA lysidine(34) synthetase TilS [Acidobacteriota bacterium]